MGRGQPARLDASWSASAISPSQATPSIPCPALGGIKSATIFAVSSVNICSPGRGPNVQAGPPQVSSTVPAPSYILLPFPMPHLFPRAASVANDLTARMQLCKLHAGRCASSDKPSWRVRDGDREKEFRQ